MIFLFQGEGTLWYFNVAGMNVESDSFSSLFTVTAAIVAVSSTSYVPSLMIIRGMNIYKKFLSLVK